MPSRTTLRIGTGLVLPDDAVTGTFGFIGNRGSGKTYGAKVMAEEMLKVGAQVVVLDPVDAWYGLRYGAKRGHSGLPVYVFGGAHGDAPLEATAGKLLADVVVEQGISAVFSMRHLPKAAQRRFAKDFAEQLYLRKGEDQYRTAVHVVIEEAHTFAPQTQGRGEDLACLGAIQDLVLQGRGSGIGVTLVTQRVQAVSKAVLELTEVMCAFRTTGPLARKKLKEWFEAQDGEDHLKEFLSAITTLQSGHAWVWSPGYLELFKSVKFRQAETFDSSATPKAGHRRPTPSGKAAALDLDALGDQIRETVERADANDPKKLRATIAQLTKELMARPEGTKVEEVHTVERVEIEVVPPDLEELLVALVPVLDHLREQAKADLDRSHGIVQKLMKLTKRKPRELSRADERLLNSGGKVYARNVKTPPPAPKPATSKPHPPTRAPAAPFDPSKATNARDRILMALVQYPDGLSKRRAAAIAGESAKKSTVGNAITALRKEGLIVGSAELLQATPKGVAACPPVELPTGLELIDHWRSRLGVGAARQVFDVMVDPNTDAASPQEIASAAGLVYGVSTFGNAMTKLRNFGIVQGNQLDPDFAASIE